MEAIKILNGLFYKSEKTGMINVDGKCRRLGVDNTGKIVMGYLQCS
jgi:hypothetical protein